MINPFTQQVTSAFIKTISLPAFVFSLFFILLTIQSNASNRVRFVSTKSCGKGDGSSWTNACSDLHRMINKSEHGDQILIAGDLNKPNNYATLTSRDKKSGVKGYIMSMCTYKTTKSATYILMDPNNPLHLPKYSINWSHSISKNRPAMYLILQII